MHPTDTEKERNEEQSQEEKNQEEQTPEPAAPNGGAEGWDGTPNAPEEEDQTANPLEQLQEKYDAQSDQYLRLMAEYDNFRKRSQKEKDDIYQNATVAVLAKLLSALDDLERAETFPKDSEDFVKGFDMICCNFKETLKNLGLEPFGEAGEPFDAELHHAVMHIEDEKLGENVVAQVLQKGYKLGDRVVRYAMVQTAN